MGAPEIYIISAHTNHSHTPPHNSNSPVTTQNSNDSAIRHLCLFSCIEPIWKYVNVVTWTMIVSRRTWIHQKKLCHFDLDELFFEQRHSQVYFCGTIKFVAHYQLSWQSCCWSRPWSIQIEFKIAKFWCYVALQRDTTAQCGDTQRIYIHWNVDECRVYVIWPKLKATRNIRWLMRTKYWTRMFSFLFRSVIITSDDMNFFFDS